MVVVLAVLILILSFGILATALDGAKTILIFTAPYIIAFVVVLTLLIIGMVAEVFNQTISRYIFDISQVLIALVFVAFVIHMNFKLIRVLLNIARKGRN